jgi:ribulose-5-phosphate 4-epimerase/fuculose-1-phosphate aldolase
LVCQQLGKLELSLISLLYAGNRGYDEGAAGHITVRVRFGLISKA